MLLSIRFANLKFILVVLFNIIFFSCKQNSVVQNNKQDNPVIDYKNVDIFPVLPECENEKQNLYKACFYTFVSKRIKQSLNSINLTVNAPDTITVKFIVDNSGKASVYSIIHSNKFIKNTNIVNKSIKESINNLPVMKPAVKMGVPVKSEYTIPIILY